MRQLIKNVLMVVLIVLTTTVIATLLIVGCSDEMNEVWQTYNRVYTFQEAFDLHIIKVIAGIIPSNICSVSVYVFVKYL